MVLRPCTPIRPDLVSDQTRWLGLTCSERETETQASGGIVLIPVAEAIAVVCPAGIRKDAAVWGVAILHTETGVGARPLLAIHCSATAHVNVGCKASGVIRQAIDQAAAEVMNGGAVSALSRSHKRSIFLRVEPGGIHTDADIPAEEVVESNAAAPAVIRERSSVAWSVAHGILAEEIHLPFAIRETGSGFHDFVFLAEGNRGLARAGETA
jgi:hypothetical protein